MKSLETDIIINAPIDPVWNILVDFDSYPEWNPFIKSFMEKSRKVKNLK